MFVATRDGQDSESSSSSSSLRCRPFEFVEIQLATDNFDESLVIGRGGFGKVYKGTVVNGASPVVAAIKRLDSTSSQGAAEFWAEVEMLSKLQHSRLVSLIGFCNVGKEMILVYEYMPNGTLEDHLHKFRTPLSWLWRLKICIDAARGLEYLHTGMGIEHRVVHRDVKSSNILLSEIWAAKISDFGLSRVGPTDQQTTHVSTKVKGTFGYLDPNYFRTGRLTSKSDVYAFGVVLFEVLCRKRAVDGSPDDEEWGLATWAQESIKKGSLRPIVDSELRDQISPKCLKEFGRIAHCCLHDDPKKRPTMAEVVFNLEAILVLQMKYSLQHASTTIFGRMVDMFPFPFKGEQLARSTGGVDDDMFMGASNIPAEWRIPNSSLKVFKFADLKRATSGFSPRMLLGEGGFGRVFIGWVEKNTFAPTKPGIGMAVAVKKCRPKNIGGQAEWLTEVSCLGWLSHPNIVSLLGYCNEGQRGLLVYEYMQNGNYKSHLQPNAPFNAEPLSWGKRLNIMIGVARGLTYLHSSKDQLIYRGVTSSNILLDQDFNAKLGDFGLVRCGLIAGSTHVSSRILGTFGYMAPEYALRGNLSVKNDMYGFGVVLLETLTGLTPFDRDRPEAQVDLVDWAKSKLAEKGKLKEMYEMMDPRLEGNYPAEAAFECAALALRCVAWSPKDRPSSEEALQILEQIYAQRDSSLVIPSMSLF